MSAIADTALRSVIGLVVVIAMLITIWVARDSSARTGAVSIEQRSKSPPLYSARNDRLPVKRTSITRERLHELQASPTDKARGIGTAR